MNFTEYLTNNHKKSALCVYQVIWHINPSGGDAGEDSIVLQADEVIGGSDSGFGLKYEAAALAIEGHT